MFRLLSSLFLILISVESIQAQCYRPAHNYYQQSYYPSQDYYPVIPKIIEVEVHRDHYYSIDPLLQQSLLADLIVARMIKAQNTGSVNGTINNGTVNNGTVNSGTVNSGSKITNPVVTGLPDNLKYRNKIAPSPYQDDNLNKVMIKSCNKCHGPDSKWPLVTNDDKLLDITELFAWKMFGMVNTGEMPKSSPNLDDVSTKLFYNAIKGIGK